MKKVLTLTIFTVFVIHFSLTMLYNLPIKNNYINAYMTPIFTQGWRLFAPDPPLESSTIFFRYKSDKKRNWSTWVNPGNYSKVIFDHNRFSYHGKLSQLSAEICHYLSYDISQTLCLEELKELYGNEKQVLFNQLMMKKNSIDIIRSYLRTWVSWRFNTKIKEAQVVCVRKNNQTKKQEAFLLPHFSYQ